MLIDCPIDQGTVEERSVYESPFIGVAPEGPDVIFVSDEADGFLEIVKHLRNAAAVGPADPNCLGADITGDSPSRDQPRVE